MWNRAASLLLWVAAAHAPAVLAGANTKPEGGGIVILTTSYYWSDSSFGDSLGFGTTPFSKNGEFDKIAESLWFEYGLRDNLTLIGQADYGFLTYRNDDGELTNSDFGNPGLALKWRFREAEHYGDTAWALQGRVKLPAAEDELPTGYYETQYELKLLASRDSKLFGQGIWVSGDIGYRWRTGGASDEFRLGYDVGSAFGPWLLLFVVDGEFGVGNNDDALALTNPQLARDSDRITVDPSAAFRLADDWWLQFGAAYDIAGRDTGQGKEIKLGLWYTF